MAPSSAAVSRRIQTTIERVGFDLVVVSVVALLTVTVLSETGFGPTWVRLLVGLPLVLVLPGYALVSALFPGRPKDSTAVAGRGPAYSPGTPERLALSFVCSLALLPLLAVGHGIVGVPFETATVLGTLTVVVVGLSAVSVVRRHSLSAAQRYDPPSLVATGGRLTAWFRAGETRDTVLSAVLGVAVVLAVGTLAFGLIAPTQGQSYTSISLVTEGDGGEFVAANYPTNFTAGEARPLTVQVENHYQSAGNYTTVVELQRVEGHGTESVDVVERERLDSVSAAIPANESWRQTHTVQPTMTGQDLRLIYYVYRGEAPATADAERAEATVHLWVTVE